MTFDPNTRSFDPNRRHEVPTDELRDGASIYSLGLLEPEEAKDFERHLESGCSVCESEVRQFSEAAAQALYAGPLSAPSPRVRERLMEAIGGRGFPSPTFPSVIFRAAEGEWQTTPFEGITLKPLYFDAATGNQTSLVRLAAGAVYRAHHHDHPEHCYVLEGDLKFEDHTLHSGDYEVALPSTHHSVVTTTNGCLLLIINNQSPAAAVHAL